MMKNRKYLFLTLLILSPEILLAQSSSSGFFSSNTITIVLVFQIVVLLAAIVSMVFMMQALKKLINMNRSDGEQASVEDTSMWEMFLTSFNSAVPLGKEKSVEMDHEYDGIKELNNKLPGWWLYGFYFTIILSLFYLINFHVMGDGNVGENEFVAEMANAEKQANMLTVGSEGGGATGGAGAVDENSVEVSTEESDLTAGKEIFTKNCAVCHGDVGQGQVGPNLTDKNWLHGGDIKSIFKVVKNGVPEKGMIAWVSQLSAQKMAQVSSYIYSLEGTDPPNPKAPQGDIFER